VDPIDKKQGKDKPQSPGDLDERRGVIEEYIASLRRFMKSILRELN